MGFEIILVNAPTVAGMEDPREAQATFLTQIGYHAPNYDPRTKAKNIFESVPHRIFSDYFLKAPADPHKVEDMAARLKTTVATIYRHLNKIKRLDILDEVELESRQKSKVQKGYRLRFGSFPEAWRFTETDIELALDHYRQLVEHVWETYGSSGRGSGSGGGGGAGGGAGRAGGAAGGKGGASRSQAIWGGKSAPAFRLRVVDTRIDREEEEDFDVLLLTSLDYLSPRGISGKSHDEIRGGVGYRLLMDCFVERSDRLWSYDELCTALDTTFPTVSRYITKLKSLDLLEEVPLDREPDEMPKKAFRLRDGDLTKAWNLAEAQARAAVRNYRKSVEHLAEVAHVE